MSLRKSVVGLGRWSFFVVPVAWAVACGDSTEDCEDTQTCIPPTEDGGEANGGGGGTGGSPSRGGSAGRGGSTGGSSGSGARGGAAGSGASGAAGEGGEGGDAAPTVVSVTLDGSEETEDIDVYAELVIEFSEPIDEATLTSDSVHVTVGGHTITGEVTVDDATHATFTPLERYYLTAEHTLTVTTDVTDTSGTSFEDDYELGFTVRDGAWSHAVAQPPEALPNTDEQMEAAMGVDGAGNVLVAWAARPSSLYARWYRQGSGWEAVQTLSSSLSICPVNCVPVHVKVNKQGDAIVATASGSNVSAYQFRNGAWGPVMALEVGETPPTYTGIGISDAGEAHVMTARTTGAQTGALITRRTTSTGSWRPVEESAAGAVPASPPNLAFDANGNGLAVWPVATSPVAYAIYEQASGSWAARAAIPRSTAGSITGVTVGLRPEGDGVVLWNRSGSIAAVNYTGTGFADVNPIEVSDPAEPVVSNGPVLAFDGADFIAAFDTFGDTEANRAWSARLRNGTWGDPVEIGAQSGRYAPPALGADASGNTMALLRVPLMDSWEEPFFNRYRRTTAAWGMPARLLSVKEYRDDPAPAFVVAPNGVAAAALSYSASEKVFEFDTSVVVFE